MSEWFDYQGLWHALEERRIERGLTKTGMVKEIDWVGARVIDNLKLGKPTTCQHVTGLLRWLGRSPESFMPGVVDGPQYALPDLGPVALRWSMPALWEAVDAHRRTLGRTWPEVEAEFGWKGMRTFGTTITYGIPMDLAMRITRWLDVPAVTFLYAAEPKG